MAVVAINRSEQKAQPFDCARLIPGELPGSQRQEGNGAQSERLHAFRKGLKSVNRDTATLERRLGLLIPSPLESRIAWKWLRSMAIDWALVSLNWLIVGGLLIPLRALFPRVRSFEYAAGEPASLLGMAMLHAALITLVAYTEGLHLSISDVREQGRILGKSVLLATAILCLAYKLQGGPWITTALFCTTGFLDFSALWAWRWRWTGYESIGSGRDTRNVLIVGAGAVGRRVAARIEERSGAGRKLCGFLDDERSLGNGVIGRVADLARIARKEFVDEVILAAPRNSSLTAEVLDEARHLRLDVEIVPDLFGCNPVDRQIERVGDLPVICLHAEQLPAVSLFVKRLVDALVAGGALIALSPLLAAIAALVKVDSPGPALYCALRVGRKGKLFRCYKFRTMVSNADDLKLHLRCNNERAGPFFKISNDPRITRLGHYLRRYSLDELPQLWNVVKGEMSLVGPRPHPVDDVAEYEIEHLARLDVTPGITGLWQVTARRDPSFHRGMELDREYIRKWSLLLDAQILLKTVLAVVQGSGA